MGSGLERRVLFEGYLDVDFSVVERDEFVRMLTQGTSPEVSDVLARGFRVILDKDGLERAMVAGTFTRSGVPTPTEDEYRSLCDDVLYHALWAAKKLRRGELWAARSCVDEYLERRLVQMATWHAVTGRGRHHDTWYEGRFLESWADRRLVTQLSDAFAHYTEADVRRALVATLDLFRWVARETAVNLGYRYPDTADERVTTRIRSHLTAQEARPSTS
ncbi:MAG: aminoglycoside 6-adenylyltransferase [Phycicoccus sp.]